MTYREDNTTFSGTLTAGASETIEVDTRGITEDVYVLLDNGTSGESPPGYSLEIEVWNDDIGEWLFYSGRGMDSAETARSWTDPALPPRMRYRVTNQSGASGTYRLYVFSLGI